MAVPRFLRAKQDRSVRSRLFGRRVKRPGLAPGTPVHTGEQVVDRPRITVLDYDEEGYREREVDDIEEAFAFKETSTVTWINVDGVHDTEVIQRLGDHFDLHPLIVEDIAHTTQRPKVEDYGDYVYIVVRMLYYLEDHDEVHSEQVSLVVGENFVFSFQETPGDIFDPVRERIRTGKGRIRRMGPAYLAYALIDAIVDHYFLILEHVGEDVEDLERELVEDPTQETLHTTHALKRELLYLRRSVWPLREVISNLQRGESAMFDADVQLYLRDVYDHTIQVIDTTETFREMVSGMLDIYLSSLSNKMNEVMKVLTIIATIFIPLTFIAGVYGMNFDPEVSPWNMPEIVWQWGYPVTLAGMLVVAVVMLTFIKRKGWL